VGEGRAVRVRVAMARRGGRHSFCVVWGCGLVLRVNGFGKGIGPAPDGLVKGRLGNCENRYCLF
jgi:hypothetical protein